MTETDQGLVDDPGADDGATDVETLPDEPEEADEQDVGEDVKNDEVDEDS